MGFDGFWWILMGFDGFWWVFVGFDRFWWVLIGWWRPFVFLIFLNSKHLLFNVWIHWKSSCLSELSPDHEERIIPVVVFRHTGQCWGRCDSTAQKTWHCPQTAAEIDNLTSHFASTPSRRDSCQKPPGPWRLTTKKWTSRRCQMDFSPQSQVGRSTCYNPCQATGNPASRTEWSCSTHSATSLPDSQGIGGSIGGRKHWRPPWRGDCRSWGGESCSGRGRSSADESRNKEAPWSKVSAWWDGGGGLVNKRATSTAALLLDFSWRVHLKSETRDFAVRGGGFLTTDAVSKWFPTVKPTFWFDWQESTAAWAHIGWIKSN